MVFYHFHRFHGTFVDVLLLFFNAPEELEMEVEGLDGATAVAGFFVVIALLIFGCLQVVASGFFETRTPCRSVQAVFGERFYVYNKKTAENMAPSLGVLGYD